MNKVKIVTLGFAFCLLWMGAAAQTADWAWVKQAGGTNIEDGASIAVDSSGNTYVTGNFSGTTNFGSLTAVTSYGLQDIFVAKIDHNGNWLWVRKAGGTSADVGTAIAVDPTGNVYITGSFISATAYFGAISLTRNSAYNDVFVAKLDTSGTWLWARKAGGTNVDNGQAIATDSNANVYVSGTYRATGTFGSLPTITALGFADVFVAKLDTSGNWLWAVTSGGTSTESANGLALDNTANVYMSGGFNSTTMAFGSINLTNTGTSTSDVYIAKLSTAGAWLWAKKAGGTGSDSANDIAIDTASNVYLTGFKETTAYFGTIQLVTFGNYDIFVAKMDTNGNWLWARRAGGAYYDVSWSIALDNWSNLYLTGEFRSTAAFGAFNVTNSSTSVSDVFMAKMNTNGAWLGARRIGDAQTDVGKSVGLDASANIYWMGNFLGTVSFNGTPLTSNSSSQDIYIAKQTNTPVLLQTPNGGDNWLIESSYSIQWTSLNVSSILLDYSYDAGSSWLPIAQTPVSASLGTYSWTTPDSTSIQAMVRVRSSTDDSVYDVSDAVFSIVDSASPPQAGFSANITSGLEPLSVQFTDSSQPISGTIISWAWIFGDGGTSSAQNPLHIYQNYGSYSVSLTVTNSAILSNTLTRNNYITVQPTNPQIDLESADSLDFGSINVDAQSTYQNVILRNTGTANLTITSVHFLGTQLNFEYQLPAKNITIAPGASSTIQVRFTPHSEGALTDILHIENNSINLPVLTVPLSGTGVVIHNPPQANFTANVTTGLTPLTVQFTDSSLPGSGTLTSWSWVFGDGGLSALQSPQHVYQSVGVYSVSLTVTNSYSLTHTFTRSSYISASAPAPVIALQTATVMNFGSVNVGSQSNYQNVIFKNNGNANLVVSNLHFIAAQLNFEFVPPAGNLTIIPGGSGSIQVRFAPQTSGALWDSLFIVNNSVNAPITKIRLNGTGIAVIFPPQAVFSANVTSGLVPLSVQFTDTSIPVTGTLTAWAWDFGDGFTSIQQHPQHTFQAVGIYDISLTVTNSVALSATLLRNDYIAVSNPTALLVLLSPTILNFGSVYSGASSDYQPVVLKNNGNRDLTINNIHLSGAVQHYEYYAATESLILNTGETDSVFVRFIPQSEGQKTGFIQIENDSDNTPLLQVQLQGSGLVPLPKAPANLNINMINRDIHLSWTPVTENVLDQPISVDYYVVFVNGTTDLENGFTYHGLTQVPNYVHVLATLYSRRMFYRIYAESFSVRGSNNAGKLEVDHYLHQHLLQGMSINEVNSVMRIARQRLEQWQSI